MPSGNVWYKGGIADIPHSIAALLQRIAVLEETIAALDATLAALRDENHLLREQLDQQQRTNAPLPFGDTLTKKSPTKRKNVPVANPVIPVNAVPFQHRFIKKSTNPLPAVPTAAVP